MASWAHITTQIWITIGSSNGLLPDDPKSLPEPMLTYRGSVAESNFKINGMSLTHVFKRYISKCPAKSQKDHWVIAKSVAHKHRKPNMKLL